MRQRSTANYGNTEGLQGQWDNGILEKIGYGNNGTLEDCGVVGLQMCKGNVWLLRL